MTSFKRWIWPVVFIFLIVNYAIAVYWSVEPGSIDLSERVTIDAEAAAEKPVVGYTTTTALIAVSETMLDKSGGYLANDVMPPSVLMDNMPAWEFGVLEQIRDLALVMRRDFSRSQTQSQEDQDLTVAQPQFNTDHTRWAFPSAEGEYRKGIEALYRYRSRLADPADYSAQFYTRADNLQAWLQEVQKRLGSMSQQLSASVGRERLNIDLAGQPDAKSATAIPDYQQIKTSWWKIDDVFYESRGACWALLQFLHAAEVDFADVLAKKNATVSLKQIIRELEGTQETVWSPIILNGGGFGVVANHSLVMANYISRANAAVIDLNRLLSQG
ncbi:DUF2333 family protein [Corallincola spongiicola]|uniref:DUF2333 family protein n=1 Tax=Corallincola spongiicola TaxID=2520508 RepID=A0ABY1WR41_9GAMM|nr:DUF2333 family protein [Corallincola spongiicola]TAA47090.1 DUF2333 family protein [Corallincola spongiicola]